MMRTSPFAARRVSPAAVAEAANVIHRLGAKNDDDNDHHHDNEGGEGEGEGEGEEAFVDPYSDRARLDLLKFYEANDIVGSVALDADAAYDKLIRLTEMILLWNERLNLISRKDCDARAIYHKHVLPSVALLPLILEGMKDDATMNDKGYDVIDVGTGGGFPGLPLAMVLPSARFTLVDSIKKKLVAISEMSSDLDVTNVRVHCGRVEEMDMSVHRGRYDAVLGRSVSALTRFCGWVTNLVSREGGRLIYIIGGELDDVVTSRMERDVPIDMLLSRRRDTSDKRALIFSSRDVYEIAKQHAGGGGDGGSGGERITRGAVGGRSGVIERRRLEGDDAAPRGRTSVGGGGRGGGRKSAEGRGTSRNGNNNTHGLIGNNDKPAKGAWTKRQNDVKKQRGYDDFQRYES